MFLPSLTVKLHDSISVRTCICAENQSWNYNQHSAETHS